jgi:hypothetical protein
MVFGTASACLFDPPPPSIPFPRPYFTRRVTYNLCSFTSAAGGEGTAALRHAADLPLVMVME